MHGNIAGASTRSVFEVFLATTVCAYLRVLPARVGVLAITGRGQVPADSRIHSFRWEPRKSASYTASNTPPRIKWHAGCILRSSLQGNRA